MTTEDLVRHPSFPFVDGNVPPSLEVESGRSAQSPNADALISNVTTDFDDDTVSSTSAMTRRSFRQRFMERLSSSRPASRPAGPLNTYLVSVIGGNYPRSHPVLAIPNLLTGGPLTDEEMQLVGELMGPVKPPTASAEEIEKAGLRIVDGSDMLDLAEKGELSTSCVERCLVRLS